MAYHLRWLRSIVLLSVLLLGGCGVSDLPVRGPSGNMQVWLDQPVDSITMPLAPFKLKAHARSLAGTGVRTIGFHVDGTLVGTVETDPGLGLVSVELEWTPTGPGGYRIQAVAANGSNYAASAPAQICVGAGLEPAAFDPAGCRPASSRTPTSATPGVIPTVTLAEALPSVTLQPTEILVAEALPTRTAQARVRASATMHPPAPPTDVPPTDVPPTDVPPTDVPPTDVPPTDTPPPEPTPRPRPTWTPVPRDTTPPEIMRFNANPAETSYGPDAGGCAPTLTTILAEVRDNEGVVEVRVRYRYTGSEMDPGPWHLEAMKHSGGSSWQRGINVAKEANEEMIYNGALEYQVIAEDAAGNLTRSGFKAVAVYYCVITGTG